MNRKDAKDAKKIDDEAKPSGAWPQKGTKGTKRNQGVLHNGFAQAFEKVQIVDWSIVFQ